MTKTAIEQDGKKINYTYNEISELIREDNEILNKTIVYSYDAGGNILNILEYAYTTGALGVVTKSIPYVYNDNNWKDKLTNFDGKAITHDSIGNPLSYDGWTYTWEQGRQLKSMAKGTSVLNFKYNSIGLRTEKTVNGVPTKYTYFGGIVAFETTDSEKIHYSYDKKGAPYSMNLNGIEYFYISNNQGDITGLLDKNGTKVVSYVYDSWGKLIKINGEMSTTLGVKNPYRYRGYRYDNETGLYYLNNRFYDPGIKRFLNSDTIITTEYSFSGSNLFAYCLNNPVNMSDSNGNLGEYIHYQHDGRLVLHNGRLQNMSNIKFGSSSNIAASGCGVIAAFNVLRSFSSAITFTKVLNSLQGGALLGGKGGLAPWALSNYLRNMFQIVESSISTFNYSKWKAIGERAASVIILITWYKKSDLRISWAGMHYFAGIGNGAGKFRFFNTGLKLNGNPLPRTLFSIAQIWDIIRQNDASPDMIWGVSRPRGNW